MSAEIITQQGLPVAIKKYKNCIYYGSINQNKKDGYGILVYFTGKIFEGKFSNDVK